jgi:hypothetical protein
VPTEKTSHRFLFESPYNWFVIQATVDQLREVWDNTGNWLNLTRSKVWARFIHHAVKLGLEVYFEDKAHAFSVEITHNLDMFVRKGYHCVTIFASKDFDEIEPKPKYQYLAGQVIKFRYEKYPTPCKIVRVSNVIEDECPRIEGRDLRVTDTATYNFLINRIIDGWEGIEVIE